MAAASNCLADWLETIPVSGLLERPGQGDLSWVRMIAWRSQDELIHGEVIVNLFGRKVDHPMGDIKSAQKLLDGIPKNDPLKVLEELTSWIESVSAEVNFRPEYQLSLLRLLDDAARPYERRLTREYFSVKEPQKSLESRMWMVLNKLFMRISLSYLYVLKRYRDGDKGASSLKADLPLVTARGINAISGRLQYAAARYAPAENSLWAQLAEFYSAADTLKYLDEPVMLYPGLHAMTTVRKEFVSPLLWYASCAGTASRIAGHISQKLTYYLNNCFTVDKSRGPNSLLDFDLLHPGSPMRLWTADKPGQPGLLYIGVEGVQEAIAGCTRALEKNIVPEEINLDGNYEADMVLNALRRLDASWAIPAPTRRSVRQKLKVSIKVAKGFPSVMDTIEPSLDFGKSEEGAIWETDDISSGGFHAVLQPHNAEGVEIGAIIATRPENIGYWGVGIVRRLNRDKQSNMQVGVELLSNRVYCVSLRKQNFSGQMEEQSALWLKGENLEEANLLMQPQTAFGVGTLQVSVEGKNFLLIPIALLEMGNDYDFARYRMIEQESD